MADKTKYEPNKLTHLAGLIYDVNRVRTDMIERLKTRYGNEVMNTTDREGNDLTDKNGDPVERFRIKVSGSQVAVAAMLEILTRRLAEIGRKSTEADKSGILHVNLKYFREYVCNQVDYLRFYNIVVKEYREDQKYLSQVPVTEKSLLRVIESVNSNLKFTPPAFNFLCYLVMHAYQEIVFTAYEFIEFSGKTTLNGRSIVAAINNRFRNCNSLTHDLVTEVKRAVTAVGNNKDDDAEDGEDGNDAEEAAPVEPEKPKKGKATATTTPASTKGKAPAQTKAKKETPLEAEAENDEDEDEDEPVEEAEEEAVEAKPKTAAKKTPAKTTSTQAKATATPATRTNKKATK